MTIADHIYLVWMAVRGMDLHTGMHTAGSGYWYSDLRHAGAAASAQLRETAIIDGLPLSVVDTHEDEGCNPDECSLCWRPFVWEYADGSRLCADNDTQEVWVE